MSLHAKIAMPDLQLHPWNLNLIKMWKILSFLFLIFLHFFSKESKTKVIFAEKPQMKINSLKKQKHGFLIHAWPDKTFKGTVVNRAVNPLKAILLSREISPSSKEGEILPSREISLSSKEGEILPSREISPSSKEGEIKMRLGEDSPRPEKHRDTIRTSSLGRG